MKKRIIFFILMFAVLIFTGCSKNTQNKILKKVNDNIQKHDKYEVKANLEIISNDESYNYSVLLDNYKDKYYKVSLINKANSKEQVILKNDEAVYVITPSLNKSFKFQSSWPNNGSQIYLLESIYNDLKTDEKRSFEITKNGYVFISEVEYPSNKSLKKQKVTIDNDYYIKKVEILNKKDIPMMTIVFDRPKSKNLKEDDFSLDNFIEEEKEDEESDEEKEGKKSKEEQESEETETTGDLDDILYPLYLPSNTKLSHKQTVNTENGQRAILTFAGDKSFILVEENSTKEKEFTVIPTSGEPCIFMDAIGSISDNSVTWTSNNVDYYLTSTVMSQNELMEVAQSINITPNTK